MRRSPLARRLVPAVRVGRSDVGATTKMDSLAGPGRLEDSLRHIFLRICGYGFERGKRMFICQVRRARGSSARWPLAVWLHCFGPPRLSGEEGTALAKDFNV